MTTICRTVYAETDVCSRVAANRAELMSQILFLPVGQPLVVFGFSSDVFLEEIRYTF